MMWTLLALLLAPEPPAELRTASELVTTPVAEERIFAYDVEGAIRLGFFWWSKRGVGKATWRFGRTGNGSRFTELAAGSDPATAPLKINRWGMMTEVHDPRTGTTASFGVMRVTGATSAKGARDEAARDGSQKSRRYDLLLGLTGPQEFISTAGPLYHPSDIGLREKDSLAGAALSTAREGALPIQRGAITSERCRTGAATVLFALSESLNEALDKPSPPPRCYIHNGREFDLVVDKVSRNTHPIHGKVLVVSFTIIRRTTGDRNKLELTAAETGDLRGFPVELRYQPNYWFRVRFTLRQAGRQ